MCVCVCVCVCVVCVCVCACVCGVCVCVVCLSHSLSPTKGLSSTKTRSSVCGLSLGHD